MNPKDLLSQLTRLESSINDFSFEELTTEEAANLKKSFITFRNNLEHKIFTPSKVLNSSTHIDLEEKTKTEISEKNKSSKSDAEMLVAYVSHEIRTPLNGIIGFTDLLKEDDLTHTQLKKVNAIQTASYSLLDIINELLEYSKLSAGLEKFESVDFNLNNLIDNVVYLCNTLIKDENIDLTIEIENTIPQALIGDPSKLTQILLNLLGNAVKFVEKGSIKLSIQLKKQKKGTVYLEFSIADTGIGISEHNLKHIFNAFIQGEHNTSVDYGGTGLGLSIVKQIITNLGGDISVSSVIDEGTTFRFMLPYKIGTPKLIKTSKIKDKNNPSYIKGLRILVFEDNTLNQQLIKQRLESWFCKVHITDNAHYGLNLLEAEKIDIILMDLKMPKMSGIEIATRIRSSSIKFVRNIPIIAISADFSNRDRDQCRENNIDDFILKPYSSHELLSKLIQNTNAPKKIFKADAQRENYVMVVYSDATKANLSVLLEECLGKIDLLEDIVALYKQNILEFIGVIKTNLAVQDIEKMAFATHKMKTGLAMVQSKSLYGIAIKIEDICNNDGDKNQLRVLYEYFLEEYLKVENVIDEQLTALKNRK